MNNQFVGKVSVAEVITYIVLALLMIFTIVPIIFMFCSSFMDAKQILAMPFKWIPSKSYFTSDTRTFFTNFVKAVRGNNYNNIFFTAMLNSLIVAVTCAVTTVFFSALCGYGLAKFHFNHVRTFRLRDPGVRVPEGSSFTHRRIRRKIAKTSGRERIRHLMHRIPGVGSEEERRSDGMRAPRDRSLPGIPVRRCEGFHRQQGEMPEVHGLLEGLRFGEDGQDAVQKFQGMQKKVQVAVRIWRVAEGVDGRVIK